MNKPEFKLLPCIFCTLGYNTYVAGYRLINKGVELISHETPTKLNDNTNYLTPLAVEIEPNETSVNLNKIIK
jgi:hypothetical protein